MKEYPKKAIDLVHESIVHLGPKGEHQIRWYINGAIYESNGRFMKAPFAKCIKTVKAKALRMGEGTAIRIHGASGNMSNFVVKDGKIVKK
jgi:hypothetical protein